MTHQLHTPEGVRDIFGTECEKKQYIEYRIRQLLFSYGFDYLNPPSFEFASNFSQDIGTVNDGEIYKFFDKEGDTLALRPDFTPSVARIASKYFSDEEVVRLCYDGNVFLNGKNLQGKLKETTQMGAELIGDKSIYADSEIIALAAHSFLSAGINDFQISIGHVNLFKGLTEASGFSEDETEVVRKLIENRNFFGLSDYLSKRDLDDDLKKLYRIFSMICQSPDDWADMLDLAKKYPAVYNSLNYLQEINDLIKVYGIDKYVTYDLGALSNLEYYTGIIFTGFTYGSGEAVIKGGRYDNLLSHFGKSRPAIGFAVMIDQLMNAIDRQHIDVPVDDRKNVILFNPCNRKNAILAAQEMRSRGEKVLLFHYDTEDDKKRLAEKYAKEDLTILDERV